MRDGLKAVTIAEKLKLHVELTRRKLDFEVIRDNWQNKKTTEILDKFTDLDKGLPGTGFKHQKI